MDQFIICIDEKVEKLRKKERELAESDRKDEANMVKVRMNIYGVCKTVYEAACKTCEQEQRQEFYLQKLGALRNAWQASLEKARAHGDVEKAVAEELKLETLCSAETIFRELEW